MVRIVGAAHSVGGTLPHFPEHLTNFHERRTVVLAVLHERVNGVSYIKHLILDETCNVDEFSV